MGDDSVDAGTACFVIFLLFLYMCIVGIRLKKRVIRCKKYVALIYGQQITSIYDIAVSTSRTNDFVRRDLQKLIIKGYLTDLEIDLAANRVIAGSKTAQAQAARQAELDKYEKYACSNCGASGVRLKGEQKVCEYCGSAL